jgi:enamine deaminase RidA (YjgF/YER057c/UK114 family)
MRRWLLVVSLMLNAFLLLAAAKDGPGRVYWQRPDRSDLPFSDAVQVGDTLYLSGKLGLEPGTRKPPESVEREARLVLDEMKSSLEQAGMSMDDLVVVQVFCSQVEHYDVFNKIYRSYFRGDPPARAFVGSGPLLFGARFEVQGTAVRR